MGSYASFVAISWSIFDLLEVDTWCDYLEAHVRKLLVKKRKIGLEPKFSQFTELFLIVALG
jgi:hypothetical protein